LEVGNTWTVISYGTQEVVVATVETRDEFITIDYNGVINDYYCCRIAYRRQYSDPAFSWMDLFFPNRDVYYARDVGEVMWRNIDDNSRSILIWKNF
jgi:hypothetical protein